MLYHDRLAVFVQTWMQDRRHGVALKSISENVIGLKLEGVRFATLFTAKIAVTGMQNSFTSRPDKTDHATVERVATCERFVINLTVVGSLDFRVAGCTNHGKVNFRTQRHAIFKLKSIGSIETDRELPDVGIVQTPIPVMTGTEHRIFELGIRHQIKVSDFNAVAGGGVKRSEIGVGIVGHVGHVGVARHVDPPGRKRQVQTSKIALTESGDAKNVGFAVSLARR